MSFRTAAIAAIATLSLALPAIAGDGIMVKDPYARSSTKNAKSGAAFMTLMNHGSEDDRLVSASSDVAKRVELHTHKENAEGVMQMMEVEEGFPIAAGAMHALERGGDHVMFMGLNQSLNHGDMISVTLTFEKAGDISIEVPVDLERKPKHGMKMDHKHNHDG